MNHVKNIAQVQFLFLESNELDLYKTVVLSVYILCTHMSATFLFRLL